MIVDLNRMEYFGSEFIGAAREHASRSEDPRRLGLFLQRRRRRCCRVLQNMSLFKLWPHLESRDEAARPMWGRSREVSSPQFSVFRS